MTKTVIHVLTHKVCNLVTTDTANFWGLGDIIRGTITLYLLSKSMGFNLIIDMQFHPISKFLKIRTHEYSELIKQNENNIKFMPQESIENYILSSPVDIVYFLTNSSFDGTIDTDCKEFIKQLFMPNDEFQKYIDTKLSQIPYPIFNILHVRSGDNEMFNKQTHPSIFSIVDHVSRFIEPNDILISDSYLFKKVFEKKYHVFSFASRPVHMGRCNQGRCNQSIDQSADQSTDQSTDSLRDTLFEYILLSKSHHIKTISVYNWISGFVYWASQIYDIPLVNMKPK